MTFFTHCALRLGDNLAHLHFLRALAKREPGHRFVHLAHLSYLPQMIEVVCDLPNITLLDLESCSSPAPSPWEMKPNLPSLDVWKNSGGFWERHPKRNDYAAFMLEFFAHLSAQMQVGPSPFIFPDDLLFDYPALKILAARMNFTDWLIVNSQPMSNQCPGYNADEMEELIRDLPGRKVCTGPSGFAPSTTDNCLTVSSIGAIAIKAKRILMVSTGPSWPTFNVWNRTTCALRVVISGFEKVEFGPNTFQVSSVAQARALLKSEGLISSVKT